MRARRRRSPGRFRLNNWVLLYKLAWVAVVILFVVGTVCFFLPKVRRCRQLQAEADRKREELLLTQAQINELKLKQGRIQADPDFLEKIAREELGWAKPGETVYKFLPDEDEPTNSGSEGP
jgi:cell division protein FtsB